MRYRKKHNRTAKLLMLVLVLALILGLSVGVTIAFVMTRTLQMENTFTPAKVEVTIQQTAGNSDGTLASAVIVNDKSNIPVYIRAAVVINWEHPDGGVCGASHTAELPEIVLNTAGGWEKGSDGYYYYMESVEVGEATANLLSTPLVLPTDSDGCSAQVFILASAIQAQGTDGVKSAVQDAWGADAPAGQ